jgi:hypothetical protein
LSWAIALKFLPLPSAASARDEKERVKKTPGTGKFYLKSSIYCRTLNELSYAFLMAYKIQEDLATHLPIAPPCSSSFSLTLAIHGTKPGPPGIVIFPFESVSLVPQPGATEKIQQYKP